jgi:hypothetical protein
MCVHGAQRRLNVVPPTTSAKEAGMTSTTITSIKRIWRDVDYLQRRSFELKTGVPMLRRSRDPRLV